MFYYWLMCLNFFTEESINSFELDPAHYLCTSGYTCDAMKIFFVLE